MNISTFGSNDVINQRDRLFTKTNEEIDFHKMSLSSLIGENDILLTNELNVVNEISEKVINEELEENKNLKSQSNKHDQTFHSKAMSQDFHKRSANQMQNKSTKLSWESMHCGRFYTLNDNKNISEGVSLVENLFIDKEGALKNK